MVRAILPILLAFAGLGAGVGAGLMLRPASAVTGAGDCATEAGAAEADDCAVPGIVEAEAGKGDVVAFDKPFVVPVFRNDRVVAMVVMSLAVEVAPGQGEAVSALQPRLRDGMLAVLFRHANSGGFDGSFTTGEKMADLKSGLLAAARDVLAGLAVAEVLVTDIVRQDA